MITSQCEICGKEIIRGGAIAGKTCSRECASELRRRTKPVTKEWLEEKYLKEGLGTVQIGRLVNRHPKRVYEWLINLGIPLREKWYGNVPKPKPFHDRDWLAAEYAKGKSFEQIGMETGASAAAVFSYFKCFGFKGRSGVETAKMMGKKVGNSGPRNGMYGKKGPRSSNWKGGGTPERQAFYSSQEWVTACSAVWKRDDATCRRCGQRKSSEDQEYCIHHIVSFSVKALRAELSNLLLLCKGCHKWIHSKKNTSKEFIKTLA